MAGITHTWDGTRLVITSDSGTSSCDLKGEQGVMGPRGAQGCAGIVNIDPTLSTAGYGADAKAVGDRLKELESGSGAVGVGIERIEKTSTLGLVDTYTITLTDGRTFTFTVTNGENGGGSGGATIYKHFVEASGTEYEEDFYLAVSWYSTKSTPASVFSEIPECIPCFGYVGNTRILQYIASGNTDTFANIAGLENGTFFFGGFDVSQVTITDIVTAI